MISNQLPIGVPFKDGLKRLFVPVDLVAKDLKDINDINSKKNYPFSHLLKTLCLVVDEVDGVKVRNDYILGKSGDPKYFPEIAKNMYMTDVSYALIACHIHNFQHVLEDVQAPCPQCSKDTPFNLDLRNLDIAKDADASDPTSRITVTVSKPYICKETFAKQYELDGREWAKFTLRAPTIGDSVKCEKYFNMTKDSEFIERLILECIDRIETEDGEEMPEHAIMKLGAKILTDMPVKSYAELVKEFSKIVPSIDLSIERECTYCAKVYPVGISTNFLFQIA